MSKVEDLVCESIQGRAQVGANKYGVTMERDDLRVTDWLKHAQEEALDLSVYLQRLLMDFSKVKDILYSDIDDVTKVERLKEVM